MAKQILMNTNDMCEVVLTEVGAAQWNRTYGTTRADGETVRVSLWELMNIFGPVSRMGSRPPFVNNWVTMSAVPTKVKDERSDAPLDANLADPTLIELARLTMRLTSLLKQADPVNVFRWVGSISATVRAMAALIKE